MFDSMRVHTYRMHRADTVQMLKPTFKKVIICDKRMITFSGGSH
jgi:hypothetical protein